MKLIMILMMTLLASSCVERSPEEIKSMKPQEGNNAFIEVHMDKELGILCFLTSGSNEGIDCIKGKIEKTSFRLSPADRLERYIDKESNIVCYQSRSTSKGISCLPINKE